MVGVAGVGKALKCFRQDRGDIGANSKEPVGCRS